MDKPRTKQEILDDFEKVCDGVMQENSSLKSGGLTLNYAVQKALRETIRVATLEEVKAIMRKVYKKHKDS